MSRFIYFTVMFIVLIIGFNYLFIDVHEQVHKNINYMFGANTTEIKVTPFEGYTIYNYNFNNIETDLEFRKLHSLNEIISYPLLVIFNFIIVMWYFNKL